MFEYNLNRIKFNLIHCNLDLNKIELNSVQINFGLVFLDHYSFVFLIYLFNYEALKNVLFLKYNIFSKKGDK